MKPYKDPYIRNYLKVLWERCSLYIVIIISAMIISVLAYKCYSDRKPKVGDTLVFGGNGELYYDTPNKSLAFDSERDVALGIVKNSEDSGYVTNCGIVRGVNTSNIKRLPKKYKRVLQEDELYDLDKEFHKAIDNQIKCNDPFMEAYESNDIKKMRIYRDSIRYYSEKVNSIFKLIQIRNQDFDIK